MDSSADLRSKTLVGSGLLPTLIDSVRSIKLPDISALFENNGSSKGNIEILPAKRIHDYVEDFIQPVEKTGAGIVEGAVRTGVDQAITSIADELKINMLLIVAVIFIHVVVIICGVNLCLYFYKKQMTVRTTQSSPSAEGGPKSTGLVA